MKDTTPHHPPETRAARTARKRLALAYGLVCHAIFLLAVAAMVAMMFFGMSRSFGAVPQPWAWGVNALLLLQFPLAHSLLLTGPGRWLLARLAPRPHGSTLSTTSFAIVASLQLLALFTLWTPSGVIWWQAEGAAFWVLCTAYALSWGLLAKASFDAGAEVQSGLLGWLSLLRGVRPIFPDMPEGGLFRLVRQPIYVSFALTTWTVPVWTPDQLMLAAVLTLYCLIGPLFKERRFGQLFGHRFERYRATVPYWLPIPAGWRVGGRR